MKAALRPRVCRSLLGLLLKPLGLLLRLLRRWL